MKLYIFDVDATAIDTMIHEIDRISSLPASAFSTLSLIVAATTSPQLVVVIVEESLDHALCVRIC